MREPKYALEKARSRYRIIWRDALLGAEPPGYSVSLEPPSAAVIAAQAGDVSAWLVRWRRLAEQYPGVELRTRTIRTTFGAQPVYTHLDISDMAALAGLSTDTTAHWQRARARWEPLCRYQPGAAIRPWLTRIVDLDDYDFGVLLAAADWFRTHPRSGLTVRSVPVPGMHTKWLARHRSLVLACLGNSAALAEPGSPAGDIDPADIPVGDLDALGLRPLPREIGVVLADPALRPVVGGLRQVSAPVDQLAGLPLDADTVLIVENKEPALAWSDTAGLVIIHSLGNHLDVLSRLPWVRPGRCWYWGDLDRHGFTLLSRARALIPSIASLLMTPADVEIYHWLGVAEDLGRYDPPEPTLTPAEASALAALQLGAGQYLRTEQERIPVRDAEHALMQALNRGAVPTAPSEHRTRPFQST